MPVIYTPKSSMIKKVSFNKKKRRFLITFNNGNVYEYPEQSVELCYQFQFILDSGGSIGQFFNKNLRNKVYRKVK